MKNFLKIMVWLAFAAVLIGIVVFIVKLIKGAIAGAFNLVLGIVVIIALVAIVIWMLNYASKS